MCKRVMEYMGTINMGKIVAAWVCLTCDREHPPSKV